MLYIFKMVKYSNIQISGVTKKGTGQHVYIKYMVMVLGPKVEIRIRIVKDLGVGESAQGYI